MLWEDYHRVDVSFPIFHYQGIYHIDVCGGLSLGYYGRWSLQGFSCVKLLFFVLLTVVLYSCSKLLISFMIMSSVQFLFNTFIYNIYLMK